MLMLFVIGKSLYFELFIVIVIVIEIGEMLIFPYTSTFSLSLLPSYDFTIYPFVSLNRPEFVPISWVLVG